MVLQFIINSEVVKDGTVSDFISLPRIGEEVYMPVSGYMEKYKVKNLRWFMWESPITVEIILEDK